MKPYTQVRVMRDRIAGLLGGIERRVAGLPLAWKRAGEAVAVTLIIVLAAGITFYRIDEPGWESGHQGYIVSEHAINARYTTSRIRIRTKNQHIPSYGDCLRNGATQITLRAGRAVE